MKTIANNVWKWYYELKDIRVLFGLIDYLPVISMLGTVRRIDAISINVTGFSFLNAQLINFDNFKQS